VTMRVRILIADDHAMVAEGLRQVVAAEVDFEVVDIASDGEVALQRAIDLEPDIVVMDMAMPRMNGIEATRAIHERAPGIRVVMLSMYSNPEYVFRALEAGASAYLAKDSASRELVEAIRTVRSGRRYFSAQIAESLAGREAAPPDPLSMLSVREGQVLRLLADGKTTVDIAGVLDVSPKTVETYRARVYEKLDIHDLPSLVRFAIQRGLTSID
jgi:DNA-binding NarL/FixJ family response regulator